MSYIVLTDSARLVSKVRKFLPFLVKPLTSVPVEIKILSLVAPTGPPNSKRVSFPDGKVLNDCCNKDKILKSFTINLLDITIGDMRGGGGNMHRSGIQYHASPDDTYNFVFILQILCCFTVFVLHCFLTCLYSRLHGII